MNGYDQSIADLLRSTIHDAQDLVRGEIALARSELREEVRRAGAGAAMLAAAAVAGSIAALMLLTALAWVAPAAFGWPVWTGFAIVGGLVLIVAAVLGTVGMGRLNHRPYMPLTAETMKENVQWTRARRP